MRTTLLALALATSWLLSASPVRAGDEFVLTAPESEAFKLIERQGLTLLARIDQRDVFLVRGPDGISPEDLIAQVLGDPEIDDEHDKIFLELNAVVRLPEAGLVAPLYTSTTAAQRALQDKRVVAYHGRRVWVRYARQHAGVQVRLADAHLAFGTGTGIVAVIDSGVDASHPALAGGVLPGYDFTRELPSGAERLDVQADHPILNPTNVVILDNDAIVPLNPSAQVLMEPGQAAALPARPTPATFGHGTMVASLVKLVAPGATILPLKAFDGDGTGRLFNVIRALYLAEAEGAKVVNLSLSLAEPSRALADAVRVLYERDIFVVAAAGNTGQTTPRYPAALAEAFGVAALTPGGRRAGFSSHGDDSVKISAPGEAVVAAFPGGQYALAWGTSFATPLVAGAVALMLDVKPGINWDEVWRALGRADPLLEPGLGAGRLNVYGAVGDAAGMF